VSGRRLSRPRGEPRRIPEASRRTPARPTGGAPALDGPAGTWEQQEAASLAWWLARHPESSRLRRPAPGHVPTVAEISERAEAIMSVDRARREGIDDETERALLAWWHELSAGFWEPIERARQAVRSGDPSGIETLVRFLEADVYCFSSGYLKADAADALKRAELDAPTAERLRAVILAVVDSYDRREFRAYVRLARHIDNPAFREALRARLTDRSPRTARHARWVLVGLSDPSVASFPPERAVWPWKVGW